MEEANSPHVTKSSYKRVVDLLLLSVAVNIAFYLLSLAGSTLDFIEYVVTDYQNLLKTTKTLLDLTAASILNAFLIILVLALMRSFPEIRKSFGTRIFFIFASISIFTFVLAKIILVGLFGVGSFRTLSFFVYSSLLTSFLFSYNEWIQGFEYSIVVEDSNRFEPGPRISWTRLLGLLKPDAIIITVGMLALGINSIAQLAIPYYFGQVVDVMSSTDGRAIEKLTDIVIMLFLVFILGGISGYVRSYMFNLSGYLIVKRLRCELFKAIILQDIEFFDETQTGDLLSRLGTDTQALQSGLTVNGYLFFLIPVSMLVRSTAQATGAIIILVSLSWKLTLVMFMCVPLVAAGAVIYGNYVDTLQEKFQQKLADSSAIAQEVISQIRTVRSFAKEEYSLTLYSNEIEATHAVGVKIAQLNAIFMGAIGFFPQAGRLNQ